MAEVKIKTPDGVDWEYLRRVLWTAIVVWAFGVRMAKIDPFDDLLTGAFTLGTVLDVVVLWAFWLVVWYLWHLRPQKSPS